MGRDRLDADPFGLQCREYEWDRACPARDAAVEAPALDRCLEHTFQPGDDRLGLRRPPVGELDLDGLAAKTLFQLLGRSLDDHSAAADDREPVSELVGLFHVVGREQDRQRLALGEPLELVPHRGASLGIEAGGRLVQEEDLRPMNEPEADVEPPFHPAGVAAHDPVGGLCQPEQLEQLGNPRFERTSAHPLHAALKHQILAAGRIAVDARALRHVADCAAHGVRLPDDVVAGDLGPARVRLRQRREHLDRSRLPGSVRSEQAKNLAGANGERDALECLNVAVALPELVDDDRVHAGRV